MPWLIPDPTGEGEPKNLTVRPSRAPTTALSNIAVSLSTEFSKWSGPVAIAETATDNSMIKVTDGDTTVAAVHFELRLIVEALIVCKAGFGNSDLIRFNWPAAGFLMRLNTLWTEAACLERLFLLGSG